MNELEQKVAQLKAMTPDELDDLDFYKFGYQAYLVYEAEKLMPKKEGTMKGVTPYNSFTLYQEADAIANVNGKPYLATKQEDPDDEDDKGLYVWAFSRPEDSSSIDYSSYTQDKAEAIADFKEFLTKKESSGLYLIEGILNIEESPRYNDEELPLGELAYISQEALKRSFVFLGKTAKEVLVYEKQDFSGFTAGLLNKDKSLAHFLDIKTRKNAYPTTPSQLSPDYHQVSWVIIAKDFEQFGYTRNVYMLVAQHYDLVSDHEQYLGAKKLWQSLARSGVINVYVFDGFETKDYVRDESGNLVKYNGTNINEKKIWGDSIKYNSVLLVATTKELI